MDHIEKESISSHSGHRFSLVERQILKMEGVVEILTFDERSIAMETLLGPLVIKGKDLNIRGVDLEKGHLHLEGYIYSLEYASPKKSKGFWARLFK